MGAQILQLPGHGQAILNLQSPLEAVAHICLHKYSHIGTGRLHHLLHTHTHEAHAVVERAAELIASPVGVWGKELGNQIAVPCMNLHAVESGVTGRAHGVAKLVCESLEFIGTQSPRYGGGI